MAILATAVMAIFFLSTQVAATPIELPFAQNVEGVRHLPNIELTESEKDAAKTAGKTPVLIAFWKLMTISGNFFSLVTGAIALFILFMAGYNLVTAQLTASEEISKQKMNVIYILFGLVILGIAGTAVQNFIYRDEGSFLLTPEGALLSPEKITILATESIQYLMNVINLFLSFSGALAILWLVISGTRLVINPGTEEEIEKEKKKIGYIAVGIIIIGLADTVINRAVFPKGGYEGMNLKAFEKELFGLSGYILGFVGIAIFITFVIAGVLLVMNQGDTDKTGQIKTTLKNVMIGVLIIFSAYTIVSTLIRTLLLF